MNHMRIHLFGRLRIPEALIWLGVLYLGPLLACPAPAATIIANQLDRKIAVSIQIGDQEPRQTELDSQEVYPIHELGEVTLAFTADGKPQAHKLKNHALYYIAKGQNGVGLFVFGLPPEPDPAAAPRRKTVEPAVAPDETLVIPVKVLVDDDQPAQQRIWQADLERCIEAVSNVFKRAANVEFKVVAAERWDSDDAINDFDESSKEFRREVKPQPGLIAIGFSSQYRRLRGRIHFGSIAGPFCSHILIRDWPNHMTKNERHELLAHELGHYFGATHSVDPHSIMRPVIAGNRPPNSLGYHPLRFDPVNTLLINLYASEFREQTGPKLRRPSLWRFDVARKKQIRDIYAHMEKCFPRRRRGEAAEGVCCQEYSQTAETKDEAATREDGTVRKRRIVGEHGEARGDRRIRGVDCPEESKSKALDDLALTSRGAPCRSHLPGGT